MRSEQVREQDRRRCGRRLRGGLSYQLPPNASGDPAPKAGRRGRRRVLDFFYDRTALRRRERRARACELAALRTMPPNLR